MGLYARVRRAVLVEGMSRRAAAREFGLARKTVSKMLEYALPPGYQRQKPVRRPKLGPWQGAIDAILKDDKQRPRKQRHTAKRIFERLRSEHGYTRRNFMAPIPRAGSWEAMNTQLAADCMARRAQRLRGHRETIGERFERDRAALLPLPAARFEACDKTTVRVSSISLVRYRTNDYSVPTEYGHRQVLVKAYVHRIVIVSGSEVIAEHERSYELAPGCSSHAPRGGSAVLPSYSV